MKHLVLVAVWLVILAVPVCAGWKEDYRAALNNRNESKALSIVKSAAARGDAEAEFTLGLIYHAGQGVQQDDEQAYAWMLAGMEHGFATGKSAAEFVEKKMPAAKVENARKIAAEIRKGLRRP